MYGIKFSKDQLSDLKKRYVGYNDVFYQKFKEGKYLIFFSLDEEKESIHYEAIYKDSSFNDEHLSFYLLPDGSFSYDQNSPSSIPPEKIKSFYFYIVERDVLMDEEKRYKIYKPIFERISPLLNLTHSELITRYEQRKNFNHFIEQLLHSSYDDYKLSKEEIRLEINIDTFSSPWRLFLKIGKEKLYSVRSFSEFISAVTQEQYYEYGKELSFIHSLDAFTPSAQKIIPLLTQTFVDSGKNLPYMELYPTSFLRILKVLGDQYIILNNENFYVNIEPLKAEVNIKENGEFELIPHIPGTYISSHKSAAIISSITNQIHVLAFEKESVQKLYSFIINNQNYNFENVKDLFANKLFPLIEGNVKVNENYLKTQPHKTLEIKLYIDLNDRDELIIKSEYLSSNIVKPRLELLQDAILRNRIYEYDRTLEKYGIKECDILIDTKRIVEFLSQDFSPLQKISSLLISETIKQKKFTSLPHISIKANFGIEWINLNIENSSLNKEELLNILNAYKQKKKFYRHKENFIILNDESLDPLIQLEKNYNLLKKDNTNIPLYQIFKFKDNENINYNLDQKLSDIIISIKEYKNTSLKLSPSLESKLRPYQIDAVKWLTSLRKYNLSGILADDMGLGKTLETIAFVSTLNDNKPCIIISPKALLYNWENEFKMWTPNQKVIIINGDKEHRLDLINSIKKEQKIIYITSYDSLRNDIEYYQNIDFNLVILDEAQYIKNMETQKTQAVKALSSKSNLALTGTPLENSLSDLWSIFDFLMPSYLGDYKSFHQNFETLILQGNTEAKKQLFTYIRPFILRRTKKDVLNDLPPKEEKIYTLSMNDTQQKLYTAYLEKTKLQLQDKHHSKIDILALITRLRQICLDPSMFLENISETSSKLLHSIKLIKDAIKNDHKILVFSSFTKCLDHLQKMLLEENILSLYIHGGIDAKKRSEIANSFNHESIEKVLLVSLKAGGTGLNLTGADVVIILDPWWNIASENQATDRAHRIGQKNSVTVIKLVCKDSIEEKVLLLQNLKKKLTSDFIPDDDNSITSLNIDDFEFLLS